MWKWTNVLMCQCDATATATAAVASTAAKGQAMACPYGCCLLFIHSIHFPNPSPVFAESCWN